jgi:hypothetical protein
MSDIVGRLRDAAQFFRGGCEWPTTADAFAEAADEIEALQTALKVHANYAREVERLRDALGEIKQWASAYPEDIFRPVPDDKLKEASGALKAIGVDMGALHAGWARHLVNGIGGIARAALGEAKPC